MTRLLPTSHADAHGTRINGPTSTLSCGSLRNRFFYCSARARGSIRSALALPALLLSLALGGCSLVGPPETSPSPPTLPPTPAGPISIGWTQTGAASWYGEPFHGRTTSSGEVYDMEGMTAAHRTLPFGTVVRVENLTNGRSTTARINDRGPFIDGRIIDLSRWGARELEMLSSGTAQVRITIIGLP